MKGLAVSSGFVEGRDASESFSECGAGYIVYSVRWPDHGGWCSLLNYLLNSQLVVVLLHFSDFDSAHGDIERVWFELWVISKLWWTGRGAV